MHGIVDCYQLTRTFGGFSAQCLSKLFLKEFTVLLLATSLGREFQVVDILIVGVNNAIKPSDPDSVIFIYSSLSLPTRLKVLLSYGLNFCLPLYHLNFYKYFLCFEKLIFCLWNDSNSFNFSEFANRLQSVAFKHFHGFKPFKVFSAVFSRGDLSVLKKLALNKDVVVCKPDKGYGIVLIDRPKYVQSMIVVILDATKFEPTLREISGTY